MGKPPEDPSSEDAAFQAIVSLASVRERSSAEARKRLKQKGYADRAIEGALERAQCLRIIDDERFAEAFARSKLASGWGMAGIMRDLGQQGIECDSTTWWYEDLLAQYPEEYERACAFLAHHPPRAKNLQASAFRKLVAHGYESFCAYQAARDYAASVQRRADADAEMAEKVLGETVRFDGDS